MITYNDRLDYYYSTFSFLEASITCHYLISYSMKYMDIMDIIFILLTYIILPVIIILIIIAK